MDSSSLGDEDGERRVLRVQEHELEFGGHIGSVDLDDGMPTANASNLEGLFGLATIGVDFAFAKFDVVTAVFMGKGTNVEFLHFGGGGEPEEKPRKPKAGAMSVVGYMGKVKEWRLPCCE